MRSLSIGRKTSSPPPLRPSACLSVDLQLDLEIRGECELDQFNEQIIEALHPMK